MRGLVVAGRLRLESLDVAVGEHLLVTGNNGAGKSTLLGVLSGRVPPDAGDVQVGAHRIAELVQDPTFDDPRLSAVQAYEKAVGVEARPLAELGLLQPRDLHRPIGDLLLLDEPTNHLSLSLATELEEAIGRTVGTVVVASHDRWLRRHWLGAEVTLRGC